MAKYVQPNFIVDSSAAFLRNVTFDSSVYLQGVTHINAPSTVSASNPYAVVLESGSGTDLELKSVQLGTMAFEETSNYDGSLGVIRTDITNLETSVGNLDTVTQNLDASLDLFLPLAGGTLTGKLTLDSTGVELDSVTLTAIDTSAEGFGSGSDTAIPTSGLVKSYVDAAITSGVTASNGLTEVGGDIQLGGELTKNTTIDVSNYTFYVDGPNGTFSIGGTNGIGTFEAYAGASSIYANNSQLQFIFNDTADLEFNLSNSGAIFTDDSASPSGIEYAADYAGTYSERSLIDYGSMKAYVDGSISSSETFAWNGLTKTDNSIGLGGTLTEDVNIITTGAYQFGVTGTVSISGDLNVDGSITYINTAQLDVSDNIIQINTGLTGAPPVTMVSGMMVNRGTSDPYFFIFNESDDTFRIGINASEGGLPAGTQAVATREDSPTTAGVGFWNATENRIDTAAGFTYADGELDVDGSVNITEGLLLGGLGTSGSETTSLMILTSGEVVTRDLGSGAFADISNYATLSYVDASLQARDTDISNLETSVTDLSTNKLDQVASTTGVSGHEVYSGEADNVAYIKRLVAGSGASLVSDSSTVTISVTGAAGYVSKYSGTFDGTSGTSTTILQTTHSLGTGPFNISVYDNNEKVEVGVSFNGSGDITLEWSAGSLSASCSYLISG